MSFANRTALPPNIRVPRTESSPSTDYTRVIGYLRDEANKKAEFYRQKYQDNKLLAIRFDPVSLDSEVGIRLAKHLVDSEQRGDKIFVRRPNQKIRKVLFNQDSLVGSVSTGNNYEYSDSHMREVR